MPREHVVVGLSGGVDSAVSALLLHRAGYAVTGVFMKNWEEDDNDEYCSTRQDFIDAASAADVIGINFESVNFAAEYKERVFASFLGEYAAGRTPNPDVLCNAEIKFRAFLDYAIQLGAERLATGHYAQLRQTASGIELLKGADASKDQSYFLHRLTQEQLSRVLFPIGHLAKHEVRRLALEAGLPNHAKKDSTGICFVGERPFREFLNRWLPASPGRIVMPTGEPLGTHMGLAFYTLGQRQGLGIGGSRSGDGRPWFVCGKDLARNELIVVQGHDHPALLSSRLEAHDLSWISGIAPAEATACSAKTRYRQRDSACVISRLTAQTMSLRFGAPQWAMTPGQSAVLYDGEVCLGGGIITTALDG